MRRRALRRRRARPPRVLRPEAARPGRKRARLRRLPHGDGPFPALAGRRRGEIPAPGAAAPGAIRHADDPLFRPIDADDFRTDRRERQRLQQPAPERPGPDHLPAALEHPAHRSRDQRAVGRDLRRRVAERSDGQRRGPHGTRRRQSVAPRPERVRWIPAGRAASRRFRSRRSVRSPTTRRSRTRRRNSFSTTCPRSSGCCSRTIGFARWRTPSERARRPLPDPDPPLNALEQDGKVVFERACAQCHGGPGHVDRPGAGDSIPRHLEPVPASRRHRDPRALRLRAVPAATRSQCADVRDHARERHQDPPHELRSRPGAC